jgi:hypothetical protein
MTLPVNHKPGLSELVASWISTAITLEQYGASSTAVILRRCAEDVERASQQNDDRLVGLREAADLTGYSADHLGRLVSKGQIANRGRKGKPLVREGDLPRRVSRLDSRTKTKYDAATDARALRSRARKTA